MGEIAGLTILLWRPTAVIAPSVVSFCIEAPVHAKKCGEEISSSRNLFPNVIR